MNVQVYCFDAVVIASDSLPYNLDRIRRYQRNDKMQFITKDKKIDSSVIFDEKVWASSSH